MNLTVMQDGSEQIHYRDPSVPIYVSRGNLRTFPNMAALCHWHEDVEILMPLRGYLAYNINGSRVTIHEGDAIFVNTRHMHYGLSADGTDCEYICITFRPQLLCANAEIQNRYVLPLLTSPHFTHLMLQKAVPEHRPLLEAICWIDACYQERLPGFEMLELAGLFQLWQGIYRLAEHQIGEAVSADGNVIIQKRMLEYIRTHYPERITVNTIAAAGGVCRTKCCQIFKKYMNRTPNEYLNSFRLEKGMELLKSTNMTITEIADACGYSSASYFTEMFTRQKGCPPKVYRKATGVKNI